MRRTFTLARLAAVLLGLRWSLPAAVATTAGPCLSWIWPEAETEFGTVEAQRAQGSSTARLGERRAIGVAFLQDLGAGASGDQIAVQLYDGKDEAVMIGEVDRQGAATLVSGELSDFDASVDLRIGDGAVSVRHRFLPTRAAS